MKSCTMYKITYVSRKKKLEERGAALVDTLFERRAERVTFAQFRGGLLALLDPAAPAALPPAGPAAEHSDDDSSGREVAPKFVFGSKKYGRRSRPQRATDGAPRPRGASEPRLDSRSRRLARAERSSSAADGRDDDAPALDHERPLDRARALELCRDLRLAGVDRALVERIFDASPGEMSAGEFFERLDAALAGSIAALDDAGAADAVLAAAAVAEAWERAGVHRPRRLLADLGFAGAALRPRDLERAVDDELRALGAEGPPDARALLLQAAHALARLRLEAAARQLSAARAERDKLRDDLSEADRRARLLAQDVDDNHARIEAELRAGLRQVEARHADAARPAAADAAAERDRAAELRRRLDEEMARRAEVEARARAESGALRERVAQLQERAQTLEEGAAAAAREAARAAEEAAGAARRLAAQEERARAADAAAEARLREAREEAQRLRDRNDELVAALEASAGRAAAACERAPTWREEVSLHAPPSGTSETAVSSSLAKGDELSLSATILTILDSEESPVPANSACPRCAAVRAAAAAAAAPAAGCSDADEADHDKRNMESVIKELEASLEQMRAEYERCEEYWLAKLDEERELLAEEQRAGDERLAELVAKIAEYERQFARAPALPTIDESAALERQVADLELEFGRWRAQADEQRARADAELARARRELDAARARAPAPAACVCAGRGPGQLRARAARAERAAQRLHARLAAADLLVKDLYIENCRLAHLPPHPRLP
ncbi:blastoderm-specific protein 25D isoform X2 [Bicyclus anynana]|uniref:Blastoderm-specific protein 25D isoform X2 n=1 Tax=Bicyclus anynana TaxID=110368 RepID=A0ABM3LKP5_BICAN|nr:blastoderm-specific protein 25D isoform X2 [Bicyclus anynana]